MRNFLILALLFALPATADLVNRRGGGGSGGANTALSNLSSVAVNLALLPGSDASVALDSLLKRYTDGYFSDIVGVGPSAYPTTGSGSFLDLQYNSGNPCLRGYINGSNFIDYCITSGGTFTISGGGSNILTGNSTTSSIYTGGSQNFQFATGSLTMFSADLKISSVGKGLQVKTGSNAKAGHATCSSGSVVVGNTSVTSTSHIHLTIMTPGGTVLGNPWLSAVTAGTGFTISCSGASDTSVVAYDIIEEL